MVTVKQEINISGVTLMSGKFSSIKILPSDKKGIWFYVEGNDKSVESVVTNVISTDNCVVVGDSKNNVKLIEHFMAACAFLHIDSLTVEVSLNELPILDGSSKEWVKAFKKAGIKNNNEQKVVFKEPIYYENEKTSIILIPSDNLKITYGINFNHKYLANKWECFDNIDNAKEIIEARTFGYLKDLEKFQKMGLALGASIENTVGLIEDGYTTELRSCNEPVKHKILDIVGDLYLSGYNPLNFNAHIVAINAGHKSHIEFAKLLKEKMEKK